ncbi:hypothetical protein F4821DRAFT_236510 [Hypoxylon rubiginosum]|uniref:Uncharacterized protein n=1 Tax=Hypoxylon rubiginosum TaxID=110542 RepID=A0ACC0D414_9PEZI|nr:hypothetical protein F4821DRAFT_236510 [Hypoxylon rubiginosum]
MMYGKVLLLLHTSISIFLLPRRPNPSDIIECLSNLVGRIGNSVDGIPADIRNRQYEPLLLCRGVCTKGIIVVKEIHRQPDTFDDIPRLLPFGNTHICQSMSQLINPTHDTRTQFHFSTKYRMI